MRTSEPLAGLRLALGVTVILLAAAAYLFARQAVERGALFASLRWTAATGLWVFAAVLGLGLLLASWTAWWGALARGSDLALGALRRLGRLNLLFFCLLVGLYAFLVLGPAGGYLEGLAVRLALFWLVVLLGAVYLKSFAPAYSWPAVLAAAWLLSGLGLKLATFLSEISTYPFSLGWSETSRYYYASLYFSEQIYGYKIPLSPLHPSRYLMQAVPFLVAGLPLWFHRFWQVLLWVGMSWISVFALARRLNIRGEALSPYASALFVAWSMLFLYQGPVYYHLLVMPAIVFWGFDNRRFWRSLVLVLVASAWAGISRLNWFAVPGLLAASLYLLETGFSPEKNGWKAAFAYLVKPLAWFSLGTLAAFLAQALFVLWSGVELQAFTSSFTSDLLWYRLWPNPTFPLGILPAILLVSGPLLILLLRRLPDLHPLRSFAIGSILLVLFAGGVLVSTKIGGGSNLHNVDAFLVILWTAGGYALVGKISLDAPVERQPAGDTWPTLALILLVPVVYALSAARPVEVPERERAEEALAALESMVQSAAQEGGEVLFITERHLLTFGTLKEVPLVEEYETVFLMEMAMAGNASYLGQFYRDIGDRRFALILIDPLRESFKGSQYPFGEENDVWVERVARPLLETYQRAERFRGLGIEILEPKP